MHLPQVPYDHGVPGNPNRRQTMDSSKYSIYGTNVPPQPQPPGGGGGGGVDPAAVRPQSLYGINAPDLPPRIDRQSKPGDIPLNTSGSSSRNGTLGRSAQERLFGKAVVQDDVQAEYITRNALVGAGAAETLDRQQQQQQQTHASLERQARLNAQLKANGGGGGGTGGGASTYDSVSSYDSYNNTQMAMQNLGRLGPNAPDDLKSVPNARWVCLYLYIILYILFLFILYIISVVAPCLRWVSRTTTAVLPMIIAVSEDPTI